MKESETIENYPENADIDGDVIRDGDVVSYTIAYENPTSAARNILMPKSLIVISDMEIDFCGDRNWTFYEKMAQRFRKYGYQIPNIIFWNVASRHDVFHADRSRTGVQLVSGQSAAVFRQVMQCVGLNPVEAMEKIIKAARP